MSRISKGAIRVLRRIRRVPRRHCGLHCSQERGPAFAARHQVSETADSQVGCSRSNGPRRSRCSPSASRESPARSVARRPSASACRGPLTPCTCSTPSPGSLASTVRASRSRSRGLTTTRSRSRHSEFIGYSEPEFKVAVTDDGVLGFADRGHRSGRDDHQDPRGRGSAEAHRRQRGLLQEQTKAFYDNIILSVAPDAKITYEFA